MKKLNIKESCLHTLSLVLVLALFLSAFPSTANAYMYPSPTSSNLNIGTYILGTSNISAYSDSSLTTRIGSVYPSDYITILSAAGNAVQVRYPLSGNKYKTGWIRVSDVSKGKINTGYSLAMKANDSVTVFRRETGNETIGTISKGDIVYLVYAGTDHTNGRAQFIYPLSAGGWKMGFCRFADIDNAEFRAVGGGQTVNNGLYRISVSSTHSVDGAGAGNDVHVWETLDVPQQKATFKHQGNGEYTIQFQTGLNLDQSGAVTTSSTVIAHPDNGGRNQRWYVADLGNNRYALFNCNSGLALDVYCYQTQSNGADILCYKYNGQSQGLTRLDGGTVSTDGNAVTAPASSNNASSGVSSRQQAMANAALSLLNNTHYTNLCQRFVRECGESIGLPGGGAGSAIEACGWWRVSTSKDNIPVGAAVYLMGKSSNGHVGIYVGDGYVVHASATACKVVKQSLSSLLSGYTYLGWGWQAGVDLR